MPSLVFCLECLHLLIQLGELELAACCICTNVAIVTGMPVALSIVGCMLFPTGNSWVLSLVGYWSNFCNSKTAVL